LVFYNPIDTTIFKRDSSLSLKDIDVLFVGRLSPEKGLETLIEAAQYLSKETRIVIIGDGELYKQLERQVQQLACNIELKGWVNNQSLPSYYNRARVFVVPSLSEPQGVVVLEAMACGVPVIASNTGGLPEMIEHGKNGWLVEPGDAKSLANTIQAALSDEIVRINAGDSALETAQSFSTEWFRQQLPCFYKQMLEAN
jgi:glycosyltransferase involved in cell wall biosynthesis